MAKPLLQLLLTVGWTFVGVILIYGGLLLFDALSPTDYRAEIRKGNVAAGLVFARFAPTQAGEAAAAPGP